MTFRRTLRTPTHANPTVIDAVDWYQIIIAVRSVCLLAMRPGA